MITGGTGKRPRGTQYQLRPIQIEISNLEVGRHLDPRQLEETISAHFE